MESATLTRRKPGPIRLARLREVRLRTWERIGLAILCVAALVGYFAYPTYPTYDSFYALLWGRDLLHLHLPDFRVYRGPTEHPLAIAFGMLCSIFGQGGARLMVLGSIASFVAAVAGMYRLGGLCFGPVGGLVAAGLLRPDAWVLSGAYWLWCSWPTKAARAPGAARSQALRRSLGRLALAA